MFSKKNIALAAAVIAVAAMAGSNESESGDQNVVNNKPLGLSILAWLAIAAVGFVVVLPHFPEAEDKATVVVSGLLVLATLVYTDTESKSDGDLTTNKLFSFSNPWLYVAAGGIGIVVLAPTLLAEDKKKR